MTGRDTFGARLRADRERAGITLDAIAASTKIKRSLFVELENNNLSHWPVGIYRRAFFRSYLDAIGIRSETLVADFVRLYPDFGVPPSPDRLKHFDVPDDAELRLTLVEPRFSRGQRFLQQLAAAASDLCAVLVLTVGVVGVFQFQLWPTAAAVSVAYCFASVAWLGRTPGAWWLATDRSTTRRRPAVRVVVEPLSLRIVARQSEPSRGQRSTDAETSVA